MSLSHSPSIVTSNLVYCSDPANPRSYPGSGTAMYDVSGNGYTATLTNGPVYSSSGYITYDGVDDRSVSTYPASAYYATTCSACKCSCSLLFTYQAETCPLGKW